MRRNRIVLLVLWLLSLAGITFIGGELTYVFFVLLSLIPFLSLFYVFLVFQTLKIYQHVDAQDLVASRESPFEFSLQNDGVIPFAGLRVVFPSRFSFLSGLDPAEYELLPGSGIRKKTSIVCRYRGEYRIGIEAVQIQDFFRLFTITHKIKDPLLVRVRPDIVELNELRQADMAYSAVTESRADRSTADVLSREYVPGDDPRLINWNVSASLNKLMVRQRIGEELKGVGILMDPCRRFKKEEDYIPSENKVLETVIALDLFFSKRGIPVSTCFEEDGFVRMDADRDGGFDEIYERLSSFVFDERRTSEKLCEDIRLAGTFPDKAAVFFVVQEWDASFSKAAEELSKHKIPLLVCLVREEPDERISEIPGMRVLYIKADQDLKEAL